MAYTDIDKPEDYFNTNLYVGNGTDAHAITGVGFQPDFVWLKNRDGANAHQAFDSIRGATKTLFVNETSAESTISTTLQSFDSDGFTVGTSSGANTNANDFASWNWLASNTTASNTDGSITSTVSANTTSGFSIVSYTANGVAGTTIGHGLGAVPSMIITKDRDASGLWLVYHAKSDPSTPQNKYLELNTSGSVQDFPVWNDTAPTSSVFTIGTAAENNTNGRKIIAYCFAEKKGFSKFGKYTGNGSANGTFVYLGFKPAWIMIKRTDVARDWLIHDNKRLGYNDKNYYFQANLSDSEGTATPRIDFLSNGWKYRTSNIAYNESGGTYVYMAFAENPFVTSTGIAGLAR